MAERAPLNEKQFEVLGWIAEGHPPDRYEGFAQRITARALERRGLVTITGQGDMWAATLTDAGVKARAHPVKKIETRRKCDEILTLVMEAPDGKVRMEGLSEQAVGSIKKHALSSPLRPLHKRLDAKPVGGWGSKVFDWFLSDHLADEVPAFAITVRARLVRPHPIVTEYKREKQWHFVSGALVDRVCRILQGVLEALEREGIAYKRVAYGPVLEIRDDGRVYYLEIKEIAAPGSKHRNFQWNDPEFLAMPAWQKARNGWSFQPSGRLSVALNTNRTVKTAQIKDNRSGRVEDKLTELFHQIPMHRLAAERNRIRAKEIAIEREEEWRVERQKAIQRLTESRRAEELHRQVELWRQSREIRDFVAALEATAAQLIADDADACREWATWASAYADQLDPTLGALRMPAPRPFRADDLAPFFPGFDPSNPQWRRPAPWSWGFEKVNPETA
ncbi:hypothetical protein [Agromyces larvae]|uniref:PE-PGRS family protein n=1 Tax=Agromyces larvae TaxID=2929802 RepID=A0ABY4BV78_9MICO|nr:hypothetical protein [Agromyces larvae]UOE43083.1 hypothetical protein MTO99_12900 [Agromyces larvae]